YLVALYDDSDEDLSLSDQQKLDTHASSLQQHAINILGVWIGMMENLPDASEQDGNFVDWAETSVFGGQEVDYGLVRHLLDPMQQYQRDFIASAHGVAYTSATLFGDLGQESKDWPEIRLGLRHANQHSPKNFHRIPSPFLYSELTRILILNDVDINSPLEIATAMTRIIKASHGGVMGLFTSIARLRAVYGKINEKLLEEPYTLFAQHVDSMNLSALIDMFREEENSCILGTDAIRDGTDIPGFSLRTVTYDRTPWPRANFLHKARKNAFGGSAYDDALVRKSLAQAFGRLVRKPDDRGILVMLDRRMPSRMLGAFPKDVAITRTNLDNACAIIRTHLGENGDARQLVQGA
ncbi:MAG: helicase C-terminal domain-containing protein, partial [Pseudomonadota bacterium]